MDGLVKQFYEIKDSNVIDRSFLLSLLIEVKSHIKTGAKPLESINSIIHDIIEVIVDSELISNEVFEEICNVASLFVQQVPRTKNPRRTFPSICDAFMSLIDISETSENRSHYRDYILKVSHAPLLEIILNFSKDVELIGIAFRSFNSILTGSSSELRQEISILKASEIPKIFSMLCQCGDYDIQVSAVETIFRLLPLLKQRKEILSNSLQPFGERVIESFLNIHRLSFDVDVRNFLVKINALFSAEFKVYSIPCLRIKISGLLLHKPRDENYDEFWVDFNEGTRCIFINCLQSDEEIEASWDALTMKAGNIVSINLNKMKSETQLLIKLKNSASSYFDSSTALAFEGKEVEMWFDSKYELGGILKKIFDRNFKMSKESVDPSIQSVMYDRKKDSVSDGKKDIMYDRKKEKNCSSLNLSQESNFIPLIDVEISDKDDLDEIDSQHSVPLDGEANEPEYRSPEPSLAEETADKFNQVSQSVVLQPTVAVISDREVVNKINDQGSPKRVSKTISLTTNTVQDIANEEPPKAKRAETAASKRRNSTKRKLFNDKNNFMESDQEVRECKKPKTNSTTHQKTKKNNNKFLESTPACKDKKGSKLEFPGEISAIAVQTKKERKTRQKKKISYVESPFEDDVVNESTKVNKTKSSNVQEPHSSIYDINDNSDDLDFPTFKASKSKPLTYGMYRKIKKKEQKKQIQENISIVEPEILRDDIYTDHCREVNTSPEITLKELQQRTKKKKTAELSENRTELPEFEPPGEEVDTNKDSGISMEKGNSFCNACSCKKISKQTVSDETKLILDKLNSIESSYNLKTEYLANLVQLKETFNSSINFMINKLKNTS